MMITIEEVAEEEKVCMQILSSRIFLSNAGDK